MTSYPAACAVAKSIIKDQGLFGWFFFLALGGGGGVNTLEMKKTHLICLLSRGATRFKYGLFYERVC